MNEVKYYFSHQGALYLQPDTKPTTVTYSGPSPRQGVLLPARQQTNNCHLLRIQPKTRGPTASQTANQQLSPTQDPAQDKGSYCQPDSKPTTVTYSGSSPRQGVLLPARQHTNNCHLLRNQPKTRGPTASQTPHQQLSPTQEPAQGKGSYCQPDTTPTTVTYSGTSPRQGALLPARHQTNNCHLLRNQPKARGPTASQTPHQQLSPTQEPAQDKGSYCQPDTKPTTVTYSGTSPRQGALLPARHQTNNCHLLRTQPKTRGPTASQTPHQQLSPTQDPAQDKGPYCQPDTTPTTVTYSGPSPRQGVLLPARQHTNNCHLHNCPLHTNCHLHTYSIQWR